VIDMRRFFILVLAWLAASAAAGAEGLRVSVAAYMSEPKYAAYEKVALARAEELLGDSNYVVLDEAKAKQLKKGWVDLADPGHVITAEEFIKRAGKSSTPPPPRPSSASSTSGPWCRPSRSTAWARVACRLRTG
jgi:hypothetical protein